MFGFRYLKTNPTQFVLHYQKGQLKQSGKGLSFFYFKRSSSISVVPISSKDTSFIFNEITADFQTVSIQGQVTYRITEPEMVASLLDYTIKDRSNHYISDDPEKLEQRIVNLLQVHTRTEIQKRSLREAVQVSDEISASVRKLLTGSGDLEKLGVEIQTLAISAIKPTPEMARALEAEAREELLKTADDAIYERRNAAVDQERRIKENELHTEIKLEEKQRQIRETKAEANLAIEMKEQKIREAKLQGSVRLETERKLLVATKVENAKAEADSQAYALAATLKPLAELDPSLVQTLAIQTGEPRLMVSMAIKELARNASKIGQLNISPDLLESLMDEKQKNKR
ncbi:SPFH domain-containing protein [Shimazuella kribbensis]|uniref:SPFH domain-containing protein n=1 Tax=Shimazuella kribbensis TaxID=139808 RepID=UPI0003F90C72|nr:SPFH domain-containing protein [Shimazuella kribbensis]